MADNHDLEITRLMHEVDRFRTATEDALQQLDWCIGYFVGCNKQSIAKALGANRTHIRSSIRRKDEPELSTPVPADSGRQGKAGRA